MSRPAQTNSALLALALFCMVPMLHRCSSSPISDAYSAYLGRDVPTLIYYLERGEDWVAEDAANYLGFLGAPAAAPALEAQLATNDRSPLVYAAIATALGKIRQPDSLPVLLQFLERGGSSQERMAVVVALGRYCAESTRAKMEELKYDPDVLVARSAKAGIARCWPEGGKR